MSGGVAAAMATTKTESVEFLNQIMMGMQPYLRVAVSQMIKDTVEPMFKDMLPGPLSTLHFTKIDIGQTPFKFSDVSVDQVKSRGGVDTLSFEMNVTWDGDLDVEMDADYIPGFGVQHVKFFGRLSVLLRPLIPAIPLVAAMSIALINPPALEMDFTGAAQALDLSLIDDTVRNIIQGIIAGMMVLPNRMIIKVDPLCELYQAHMDPVGVIRIMVESGSGFKSGGGFIKDVPDLYCMVKMGANGDWTTSTKNNAESPVWNESHDYLLSDNDQIIKVELFDSDVGTDDHMGNAECTVGQMMDSGGKITLPVAKVLSKEKTDTSVTLSAKIFDLVPQADSLSAGPAPGDENSMCGLLTVLVAGAKGLVGEAEALASQVVVNFGKESYTSGIVQQAPGIDVHNPSFDGVFRADLTPESSKNPELKFTFKNKGTAVDTFTVPLADVLTAEGLALKKEFPIKSGGVLRAKAYVLGMANRS